MIDNMLVIDAVVHPYDLSEENQVATYRSQLDAVYAAHRMSFDDAHRAHMLTYDEFFSDFSYEALACAEFVESAVDFAIIHPLPCLGFVKGYLNDPSRAGTFQRMHPNRFMLYATVDSPDLKVAIQQLKQQIDDFGTTGLKLYPAFFYDNLAEGWRLDGDQFATPLLETAQRLGIKHVAIHKALWLPPAPREVFEVGDLDTPMKRFPDLTFEMVHAGVAFVEETIDLLSRHPNLYLTLETLFAYVLVKPQLFGKIVGSFIKHCGNDRLLFATGNNLAHPDPLLKAFLDYRLPEDLMQQHGLQQFTQQDRRNILGLNAARLHKLDPAKLMADTANDEFARARARHIPGPWSVLRGVTV
jgi:predicted TIM-barrel fold metal-dependent hydrolase